MSNSKLFSQLALSAAIGISGISTANAQSSNFVTGIAIGMLLGAAADDKAYVSPSVGRLGFLTSEKGGMPLVSECYKELAIEVRPSGKTSSVDAQKVVDCTEKKIISQFISSPDDSVVRKQAENVIWRGLRGSNREDSITRNFRDDGDGFAKKITEECKSAVGNVRNFSQCAGKVSTAMDMSRPADFTGPVVIFTAIAGVLVFGMCSMRSEERDWERDWEREQERKRLRDSLPQNNSSETGPS